MHSVGIHIKDFDVSQLTYDLTINVDRVASKRSDIDFIVFQQSLIRPPMRPPFAILHERELWSYQGVVIATSLELAQNLYAMPQPKRKVFYVSNFEWVRNFDFESAHTVYSEMDLIAENDYLSDILSNHWKEPIGVVESYNIEKMLEILGI